MSILGSIISKIFHKPDTAATPEASAAASAPATTAEAPAPADSVDVTAILDGLLQEKHEKLDWRHSIVDLLKLLDLDSSHAARIELAHELHYSGSTEDSAATNIWLHAQVMQKLAENGGKVPDELKH
jgi:hypothetical protein